MIASEVGSNSMRRVVVVCVIISVVLMLTVVVGISVDVTVVELDVKSIYVISGKKTCITRICQRNLTSMVMTNNNVTLILYLQ